jgi:hypothetical protein
MPDTRLILHVKGTESETTELPKDAIRSALSQGKITYSQLIWSAPDNAWKQAREWPELMPAEPLILHVKGTEAETRHVPKQDVRSGIKQGEISHSQLIWSAADHAWKQVRELPELLPSQKLAPAPPRVPAPTQAAIPVISPIIPDSPQGPVARAIESTKPQIRPPVALTGAPKPRIAGSEPAASGTPKPKAASATPKVAGKGPRVAGAGPRVAAAGAPTVRTQAVANSNRSTGPIHVKEEEDHFHPMKWICLGMGGLLIVLLIANFFLVSLPLSSNFGRTSFSKVTVYAHFGAFMQPNVMVIHIVPSAAITEDNLADVMAALARSSPADPLTREPFDRVAITSAWTAQYSFSGTSWKELAQLDQENPDQRKDVLLAQMDGADGLPVVKASTESEDAQKAKREQLWKTFVSNFTTSH